MTPTTDTAPLWGITAYFNPLHYRRRLQNFRSFRRNLRIPLVAVELGYDGIFDLHAGDAEILLQWLGQDILWQKERLLNLALRAVPAAVSKIAFLDCDIILERADWPTATCRLLDEYPLVQPFSRAINLPVDLLPDNRVPLSNAASSPAFASLLAEGISARKLYDLPWTNFEQASPCCYGHAWAFRRDLLTGPGFYDACVIGGGDRAMCFAGCGLRQEIARSMRFNASMQEHFFGWAEAWQDDIQGRWGCVSGNLYHLWHGNLANRKYRQRYQEFAAFAFDPARDIAVAEHGAWRWNSNKTEMHEYVRNYFAVRDEDG
jgi:hypothetical protein